MKLLVKGINIDETDLKPSRICIMMSNGNFTLKDGVDIDYKDEQSRD